MGCFVASQKNQSEMNMNHLTSRSNTKKHRIEGVYGKPTDATIPEEPTTKVLSSHQKHFLVDCFSHHFLFRNYSDYSELFKVVRHKRIFQNTNVFEEGDVGDSCYFIEQGTFQVIIQNNLVRVLHPGDSFGELALLYNCSRTATIKCLGTTDERQGRRSNDSLPAVSPAVVWRMEGVHFRAALRLLDDSQSSNIISFFTLDPKYDSLSPQEIADLAQICHIQSFDKGKTILRRGETGARWIFILTSGSVQTSSRRMLNAGAIFGAVDFFFSESSQDSNLEHVYQHVGVVAYSNHVQCLGISTKNIQHLSQNTRRLLQGLSLYCSFSSDCLLCKHVTDLTEFFDIALSGSKTKTYSDGDEVVAIGDPAKLIYVLEGSIKSSSRKISTGNFVGDTTFFDEKFEFHESFICSRNVRTIEISLSRHSAHAQNLVQNHRKWNLKNVFLCKNLSTEKLNILYENLFEEKFLSGEYIVREGESTFDFYMIIEGIVSVSVNGNVVRDLGKWDYFGERALLFQEPRSATIFAKSDVVQVLRLRKEDFQSCVSEFLGELKHRIELQDSRIGLSDLTVTGVLGKGTFGAVQLVKTVNNVEYALKCVKKSKVSRMKQQQAIQNERAVLLQCYHPCIVQFVKTFQDVKYVYFLLEYLPGGDLFLTIRDIGIVNKECSRFYSGSIFLAIDYLHSMGFMFRDLKPENVLLDSRGFAKLVDFGCCKQATRSHTLVGTPEYIAPEVILNKGYTQAVDMWSLGVIMYEMIVGPLPFTATVGHGNVDQLSLFKQILEVRPKYPKHIEDQTAISILDDLLEKNPVYRLGSCDRADVKRHAYFKDFSWEALLNRTMTPPYAPNLEKVIRVNLERQERHNLRHKSSDVVINQQILSESDVHDDGTSADDISEQGGLGDTSPPRRWYDDF